MEVATRSESTVRFESFKLNLRTRELLRNGSRLKVRGHPIDVLMMSTIVDVLQPTIFATLAIGVPAFSILETAVCLKSWKRYRVIAVKMCLVDCRSEFVTANAAFGV